MNNFLDTLVGVCQGLVFFFSETYVKHGEKPKKLKIDFFKEFKLLNFLTKSHTVHNVTGLDIKLLFQTINMSPHYAQIGTFSSLVKDVFFHPLHSVIEQH